MRLRTVCSSFVVGKARQTPLIIVSDRLLPTYLKGIKNTTLLHVAPEKHRYPWPLGSQDRQNLTLLCTGLLPATVLGHVWHVSST